MLRPCICAALFILLCNTALAHARLVRASPPKDATLAQAPATIELWFNELLDDGFNSIAIFPAKELAAPTHTNFAKEKPVLDARDRTHLTLKVEPLPPGEYVLEWRVLSRDGHSAPGRFKFRILSR